MHGNHAYGRDGKDEDPIWNMVVPGALPPSEERVGICARRGVKLHTGIAPLSQPGDEIQVRVAQDDVQRTLAWNLVARRYAWRGYQCGGAAEPFPDLQRQAYYVTLLALRDGRPVGTVTLGVDSPGGLLVDQVNKADVDQVRGPRRRVAELVRLAIEDGADSKRVWTALLQSLNLLCRRIYDVSDLFIEVNPRHVAFYRRVFSFRVFGPVRMCPRVGAPSVLLRLPREDLEAMLQGNGAARRLSETDRTEAAPQRSERTEARYAELAS